MRNINKNSVVIYKGEVFEVVEILSLTKFSLKNDKSEKIEASLKDLSLVSTTSSNLPDLMDIPQAVWDKALIRQSIIKPIAFRKTTKNEVKTLSKEHNVSIATLYRWKEKYENNNGQLTSLVPEKKLGGKGKSRLDQVQEKILLKVINEFYLSSQKRTYSATYEELKFRCKEKKVPYPSMNTLINRINSLEESKIFRSREGSKAHDQKYNPKTGNFPNANYPLETVQIDHTPIDLIVIDENSGEPLGRPWLTLAIDVYSRMVVGYTIGFESPSILTTGICIACSILPKDEIIKEFEIDAEWPCWGIMKTIHTDNGKDFRSEAVARGCSEYGIDIDFRPIGLTHFGGHIERLMGTISNRFHTLPGTTFNDVKKRKNYNSEKKAVFTLKQLEKYVVTFITEHYHQSKHSGIGTSPLIKYKEGIWGNNIDSIGIGVPEVVKDSAKLKIDFLPYFERTVQNYGVSIDNIFYYSEVLRSFIHKTQYSSSIGIKREKIKYIFRRDPRDISKLYFWDPDSKTYYTIPYANMSHPSMSVWELYAIKRKLKLRDDEIDEDVIFEAYKKLKEIETTATKGKRLILRSKKNNTHLTSKNKTIQNNSGFDDLDFDSIDAF